MTETVTRTCNGTRKDGQPCRSTAVRDDGYCFVHGRSASLLPEVARRAGIASGEARRELGKTIRERIAERLQEDADEIYDTFQKAWQDGDWRAADAAINQALGRPPQAITGDEEQPLQIVLRSAFDGGSA